MYEKGLYRTQNLKMFSKSVLLPMYVVDMCKVERI